MLFDRRDLTGQFERLVVVQDASSGLRAIIAIHSTARGPGFGGIRRRVYSGETAAIEEVMLLASAMSLKCAMASLPAGGAKTVVLDHPQLDPPAAYRALGRAVEELGGRYICGPDMGTGPEELAQVRSETQWCNPEQNDAGQSTARGVLAGLRACLVHRFGTASVAAKTVHVQGLGSVGFHVARALAEQGASVSFWDTSPDVRSKGTAAGLHCLDSEEQLFGRCAIFMPCALGGVITAKRAETIGASIICGSANNLLRSQSFADGLHARGITYAPDFVVNAGAVIEGVLTVGRGPGEVDTAAVDLAIGGIERTTADVLAGAADAGVSTDTHARRMAVQRMETQS